MCSECSNRGCDERCPDCRPAFGPAELAERRLNRVLRSPCVRCAACGFEGPRFDFVAPVKAKTIVGVVVVGVFTFGAGGLFFALATLAPRRAVCTACGRSDELEPSAAVDLARPENWNTLAAARRRTSALNVAKMLLALLTLALFFYAVVWLFSD